MTRDGHGHSPGAHFVPMGRLERARGRWATSRWAAIWARWPGVAVISALATVFTWRNTAWRGVAAGIDSWQAGLVLGFQDHLQWGPQLLFTFGPYGFVEDILPLARVTATVAFVYALVITWGLAALIVAALRPSWGLLPAGVAAWGAVVIAANMLEAPELASATALGLAMASVWTDDEAARRRLPALLGALAGFALLVELNVGLVSTGLALLAVLGGRRRGRRALATFVPYVGVIVGADLAGGQHLGNLLSYLKGSLQVTLGYSSAMATTDGRGAEDIFAVVVSALALVLFALALRGRPLRLRVAVLLMLLGWGWEAFKEGFVRHDQHDLIFFGLVLVGFCLARLPRPLVPLQAAAIAAAAVLALVANGSVVTPLRSPLEDANALGQEVADLVVPSRWAPLEQVARDEMLETGDTLPAGLVSSLAPYTLAAEPWEVGLAYTYPQLRWDPEPVLQSYSAYTTYLDNLDAAFLSSARAPQRIVYQPETIDGRDPYWDSPSAQVAMYCHYRQLKSSGGWEILARVPDRCGAVEPLSTVTAHFGQEIKVPAATPGDLVVASFSLSAPLVVKVENIALKPPHTEVTATEAGRPVTYRFLPGTAAGQHIVRPAATLGYSPAYRPPAISTVTFSGSGWSAGQGTVTARFSAIPVKR